MGATKPILHDSLIDCYVSLFLLTSFLELGVENKMIGWGLTTQSI